MLTIAETPVDAPEAELLMAELGRELARITGSDGTAGFHPAADEAFSAGRDLRCSPCQAGALLL